MEGLGLARQRHETPACARCPTATPCGGASAQRRAAAGRLADRLETFARGLWGLGTVASGARLRPVFWSLVYVLLGLALAPAAIGKFGPFEISPKKTYLSLRRQKQFAMVGPGTKGRLEVGLNMKGLPGTARLAAQPPGGMCQYKVLLSDAKAVDKELIGWLKQAYDSAG